MNQPIKPTNPHVLRLEVLRNEQISPNIRRITAGGADLAKFAPLGADQWFRLFFPREGQNELRLPTTASNLWYAQFLAMGKNKPRVRNYTVRAFRGGAAPELDIDMVAHGDTTPASAWANRAKPGDPLGILDQGCYYNPPKDCSELLLVADESGLPAIMGILETHRPQVPTRAFIEIPDAADAQPLPEGLGNVEVAWLPRKDPHARPGELALHEAKHAKPPAADSHTFVVGESGLPTGLRRHLVNLAGVPKSRVTFVGYWKYGKAEPM
ncbi:siderophore-interacting protein [Segniliparus rugosus]|uniref:FAD-binding FR-type domain-containing protein n=1 Tax=Segniliparus rugosus (strain ATCC BAA-974 / DSM 45345 / CCUG 50838 / CIP 108380 / JCM 13579 / CDC 945) TaxID=679197 RepID=E5XLS2_SEGRC|nr:siderophore-interacting protein [Segniliparus rugosus]EFV14750.1 hypothetical protein HMPREF9336_00441 [Segniliparus rugosus ATCC BAA-974]